ncbi:substrate-binding periplasmic protein [Rickettsia endosymbiont of Halotydeus destructor]|uniref:substrate-binding periplasmic protein n=1 Tax=Rickettsia endosymbiont of Halotydeus destructor TaxID=2996754 RepID=UPI003BAF3573
MKLLKIFLLSLLLISCDKKAAESNIIVGTSADNPPYEFIQNGEIVGIDIDIINAIGERLNKKVVIKNFDFNGLLAALVSQNVDVVIAALSATPEREEYISFSGNYGESKLSMLYRVDDNIQTIDDLNDKIVGAQLGSSWEKTAQELAQKINIKINSLSNNLMLVEELKSKVIDVVILEEFQSIKFKENNQNLASCNLEGFSSKFAIAMSKNSGLVKEVNEAINSLKKDGTLNKIMKKWLVQ